MRIAFTTNGTDWESLINPRFGRTDFLLVYDEEKEELRYYDNRDIENEAHGAGPRTARKLFELKAEVLITGNGPGGNAARVLEQAGINIYTGAENFTIKEAFNAYKQDALQRF
jgi:predicted Fe-Mo cluster-binding NifX family protein